MHLAKHRTFGYHRSRIAYKTITCRCMDYHMSMYRLSHVTRTDYHMPVRYHMPWTNWHETWRACIRKTAHRPRRISINRRLRSDRSPQSSCLVSYTSKSKSSSNCHHIKLSNCHCTQTDFQNSSWRSIFHVKPWCYIAKQAMHSVTITGCSDLFSLFTFLHFQTFLINYLPIWT